MAKHASKGERALRKRSETKATRSRKLKRIACLHHRSHTLSSAESQDSLQKFECEVPSLVSLQSSVSGSFYHEEAAVSSDCSSRSNSVPMTFASRDRKILARNQREESKKIVMGSDSMDSRRIAALRSCKNSTHKEVQAMPPATNDRLVRESTPSSYETHIEDQRSCNKLFGKCHESRPPSAAFAGRVAEADIEDFFREAEHQQRLRFVERYNFDPVNGRPLAGRYEWASMQDHHP